MSESEETPTVGVPYEPPPPRRRKWPWIALIALGVLVVIPALLLGIWTAITMSYTYSSGEPVGYVQKFSREGWLCKTWEGELAIVRYPGAAPETFAFTVRSDSIAAEINRLQGRRVALHYEQHRGVPLSCLGESEYFVDGVREMEEIPGGVGDPPAGSVPAGDTIDPPTGNP